MARIRSVHPSLFTDEAWVSCSPLARILYIGLWTDADDQGLFEWKPLQIKMRLLPGDMAEAGVLLDELASVGLITAFGEGTSKLGAIRVFRKFQRPQKPNAVHDLPQHLRAYVGIESDDDDPATGLRKDLCEKQGGRCFYCSTEITHYSKRGASCEVDHRVPKAKGGTDDESNLVAACRPCNRGKCDRSEAEWRAILVARAANAPVANATTRVAPQMEDVGGRVEDETTVTNVPVVIREPKPKASKRCPADWTPSPADIAVAADLGFSPGEIERELATIRDCTFGVARSDWSATYRNWFRREAKSRKPRNDRPDKLSARHDNYAASWTGSERAAGVVAARRAF